MINLILCGGNGTRLWPISRKSYPKQFCKLIDEHSLFQYTIKRNMQICENFIFITNKEQYFLANSQLKEFNIKNYKFLLEPVGRNTAPAIALACFDLNEEDIVFVTPSDHIIKDMKEYEKVLKKAENLAKKGYIVTFGIKPDYPETGFGYIECNELDVVSFKEKPNYETAKLYLEKNNFYWNSGMFVFKVKTYLDELKKYGLDIYDKSKEAYLNADKEKEIKVRLKDMMNIREDSIDYCVIEKSQKVKMISSDMKWCDLGNFEALYKTLDKDEQGNISNEKNVKINSHNNMILGNDRIITTIDIENLVVVDTPDALLISNKGSSHKVKDILKDLEDVNPKICHVHNSMYRPWGRYTVLEEGYRHKIKKIVVNPGEKLSLQKHYHRNEHWIVVKGTAKIVLGEKEYILRENESTYISMGEIHRIENPGKIELIIIEIQVGEYLEEDDIVRLEDEYNRN